MAATAAVLVAAACGGAAADSQGEPERVPIVAPEGGEATATTAVDPDDYGLIDIEDGPRVCEAISGLVAGLGGAPDDLDGAAFTTAATQSRDLAANAPEPLATTLRQMASAFADYADLAESAGWTPQFGSGAALEADAAVLLAWTDALANRGEAARLSVLGAVVEAQVWLDSNCVS